MLPHPPAGFRSQHVSGDLKLRKRCFIGRSPRLTPEWNWKMKPFLRELNNTTIVAHCVSSTSLPQVFLPSFSQNCVESGAGVPSASKTLKLSPELANRKIPAGVLIEWWQKQPFKFYSTPAAFLQKGDATYDKESAAKTSQSGTQ